MKNTDHSFLLFHTQLGYLSSYRVVHIGCLPIYDANVDSAPPTTHEPTLSDHYTFINWGERITLRDRVRHILTLLHTDTSFFYKSNTAKIVSIIESFLL